MIDGSVGEVLTAPLISVGFTCVYGARGLRLLVVYNSHLLGRWVRVLDERAVIKGLVATYLGIEGLAWFAVLLYRLNRWAMDVSILRIEQVGWRQSFPYAPRVECPGNKTL